MSQVVPEVAVVLEWHRALNDGDLRRLLSLTADDVVVGGPRGSGRGAEALAEWFSRAGIRLEPRRVFHRGRTVVVAEEARWGGPEAERPGQAQAVASVFVVEAERVASVVRYPDLASALISAGLSDADELPLSIGL